MSIFDRIKNLIKPVPFKKELPITVYNKDEPSKSLFQMGDEIQFVPINIDEFKRLNEI